MERSDFHSVVGEEYSNDGSGIVVVSEGEFGDGVGFESRMLVQVSANGKAPFVCAYLTDETAKQLRQAITDYLDAAQTEAPDGPKFAR